MTKPCNVVVFIHNKQPVKNCDYTQTVILAMHTFFYGVQVDMVGAFHDYCTHVGIRDIPLNFYVWAMRLMDNPQNIPT
jgi:hypothetical protein